MRAWVTGALGVLLLWPALAPAAGARIALRWKPVPGAASYELQIARDAAFRQVVLKERTEVAGYRWSELPNATYYWRVRSFDADGRPGQWSKAETIASQVHPPVPKAPPEGALVRLSKEGSEVTLEVEPARVFKSYEFEWARDEAFTRDRKVETTREPGHRLTLDGPGPWFWRARAVDLAGRPTPPSETRSLTARLAPPRVVVTSPPSALFGDAVEVGLGLGAHPAAHSFQVEVEREGDEGPPRQASFGEALGQLPFDHAGTFRVRAAAVDAQGRRSGWSEPVEVRVALGPPVPKDPSDGATLRRVRLEEPVQLLWEAPRTAAAATVQVFAREAPGSPVLTLEVAASQAEVTLPREGRYLWKVTARDAQGNASAPSAPRSFELRLAPPLPAPRAVAPGMDAILHAPQAGGVALEWTEVEGATRYQVEWAGKLWDAAQLRLTLPEVPPGEHAWRVRAVDDLGGPGTFSDEARFHLGLPASARAEFEVLPAVLVADGSAGEVRLALFDARGRQVIPPSPLLTATAGRVEGVRVVGGVLHARYVAPSELPAGKTAELVIRDRNFEARHPVKLVAPASRLLLGAAVGYGTAFSSRTVPSGQAFLTWTSPFLGSRLCVSGRVGFFTATTFVRGAALGEVPVAAQVIPLSALVMGRTSLAGGFDLRAGLGPSLHLVRIGLDAQTSVQAAPGALGLVEAGRRLGPGQVVLGLSYAIAGVDGELARASTGGARVSLGYGVAL